MSTSNALISGWGDVFTPAGVAFNAIRLPQLRQPLGVAPWRSVSVVVRKAAAGQVQEAGAMVVAVGSVSVRAGTSELIDTTIPLRDPVTGEFVVLTDDVLDLPEYGVMFYVRDEAGAPTGVVQPRGNLPNRVDPPRTYYVTTTNPSLGGWATASQAVGITLTHMSLTGLQETLTASEALKASVGGGGGAPSASVELIVPPVLYGVQGREMNCYFDNLIFAPASRYYWDVTQITVGKQQNERWTYIPDATARNAPIGFEIYNQETGVRLTSASATLRTGLTKAAPFSRRMLFLGDSTTAAGTVTAELLALATADPNVDLELIGTKGTGLNKHEGNSGWTVARWHQPSGADIVNNPFSNAGAIFDFGYGMANGLSAYASPDWVIIHLGINDIFNATSDVAVEAVVASAFPKLEAMIASIRAYGAAIKVAVCVAIPPAAHQDAFGDDYGVNQTRWRYKRNWLIWCKALIAQFKDRQAVGIYLIPYQVSVDGENNFPRDASAPVNSRSSRTVERQNNGVHPDNPAGGYRQMADAVWAFLHVEG
jgi:lysophospholipase L1-like esterase